MEGLGEGRLHKTFFARSLTQLTGLISERDAILTARTSREGDLLLL